MKKFFIGALSLKFFLLYSYSASADLIARAGLTLTAYANQAGHHEVILSQPEPSWSRVDIERYFAQGRGGGTILVTTSSAFQLTGGDWDNSDNTVFNQGQDCTWYSARTLAVFSGGRDAAGDPVPDVQVDCGWVPKKSPGVPPTGNCR